jgi:integrase
MSKISSVALEDRKKGVLMSDLERRTQHSYLRPLPGAEEANGYYEADQEALFEAQLDARNKSSSTLKGYDADFGLWVRWCNGQGVSAMPASVMDIVRYLHEAAATVNEAGEDAYAYNSISRWVTGINHHHVARLYMPPGDHKLVKKTLRNLHRSMTRPTRRWLALWAHDINRLEDSLEYDGGAKSLKSIRDACILRIGFEGAFRRSELCDTEFRHIQFTAQGASILLPSSKNDQVGDGFTKHFLRQEDPRRCSLCALMRQIRARNASLIGPAELFDELEELRDTYAAHICDSPPAYVDPRASLLCPIAYGRMRQKPLSGIEYHRAIRTRLDAAGYNATLYGSHSLRIGFVAQATVNGATNDEIKRQTGHKSDEILNRYKRDLDTYLQNAVHAIYRTTTLPRPATAPEALYSRPSWLTSDLEEAFIAALSEWKETKA